MSLEQRSPPLTPTVELTEVVGEFVDASNLTLLAQDRDGRKWVYKAEQAMTPLWDFPPASLPRRELACYLVSEAMAVRVVPETRWADGPLGPGSAQRFLDLDLEFNPAPLVSPRVDPSLWPVAALDLVCNNADRKLGHLLIEKGADRIWAIDNGLTFHVDPKLRTVLWGLAGQPVPAAIIAGTEQLLASLTTDLGTTLAPLLTVDELTAMGERCRRLLADLVHPSPPGDRPALPWPIW